MIFQRGEETRAFSAPSPGPPSAAQPRSSPGEGGGDQSGRGTLTGAPEQRVRGKGRGRKAEDLGSKGGVVQTPVVG